MKYGWTTILLAACSVIAPAIAWSSADWLVARSQTDGRIVASQDIATPLQSTSEAVRTLRQLGRTDAVAMADGFIAGESYHGTEYLARKVLSASQAGTIPTLLIGELLAHQNADGGYGEFGGYQSTALDTAYALQALVAVGQTTTSANLAAVNYLVASQAPAGGWGTSLDVPSTFVTAQVVRAVWPFRLLLPSTVGAIARGKQFLIAQRANSLWSSDFESALALMALAPIQSQPNELAASQSALEARRLSDGSWGGDVYTTALALQALALVASPNPNPDLGSISGQVIDGDSLASIVGATVTLSGTASAQSLTASEGRFLLANLQAGAYVLTLNASGYPALTSNLNVSPGQAIDLGSIRLLHAATPTSARIEGHVTNEAGADLAGAAIAISGRPTILTDSGGRFVANDVSPGVVTITASRDGYFSARGTSMLVAGATVSFSPVLRSVQTANFAVVGTFRDAVTNATLPGVEVVLTGSNSISRTSDASGSISIENLTPGALEIVVSLSGYAPRSSVVTADGGQTLDISTTLSPIPAGQPAVFSIAGRVTNQVDGSPLSGAQVLIAGSAAGSTLTATDGTYVFSNLTPGTITISAAATGYQTVSATTVAQPYQAIDFSPALTLIEASRTAVRGRVVDEMTGAALEAATVSLSVGGNAIQLMTDPSGAFIARDLSGVSVALGIAATGYEQRDMVLTLAEGYTNDLGDIELRPISNPVPRQLTGRVVDSASNLALTRVTMNVYMLSGMQTLQTDNTGRFTLQAMSGEPLELEFVHPGYVTTRFTLSVAASDSDLGQVRLRPLGLDVLRPDLVPLVVDAQGVTVGATAYELSGTLSVRIANRGYVSAGNGAELVAFADRDGDGMVDDGEPVFGRSLLSGSIEAGSDTLVQLSVSGAADFRDAPVTARIDAKNLIVERDEANNALISAGSCLAIPPAASALEPVLKWHWNGSPQRPNDRAVFGPVMVGQLSDDNADGEIDALDVPDLVFSNRAQSLTAVSGDDGRTLWQSAPNLVTGLGSPALGDIDGDGLNEIVISNGPRTRLLAFENDGTLKWDVANGPTHADTTRDGITLADLNADGIPEIITGRRVYSNTGVLLWQGTGDQGGLISYGTLPTAADLNGDGMLEVIAGRTAYNASGTVLWNQTSAVADGFNAVGNFDADDFPEIVLVTTGRVYVLEHTGAIKWGPVTLSGSGNRGGAPTVGDFDGDGQPEIGIAGQTYYTVLETDGSLKWRRPIDDQSSSFTGSSLFDFDGDGRTEVVYADEGNLYIYDGQTGNELRRIANGSGTTLEYPVVADVDGDGRAELVVAANEGSLMGVRVFEGGEGEWMPTRPIWNQSAYHVSNVNDDGTIPAVQERGWLTHNSFRQNAALPRATEPVADLTAGQVTFIDQGTTQPDSLSVRVGNAGVPIAAGVATVAFYSGTPGSGGILLGTAFMPALATGTYAEVQLDGITGVPASGALTAVVDASGRVTECNEGNNTSTTQARPTLGAIAVATDAAVYAPGGQVQIQATITNTGTFTGSYQGTLKVEDDLGNLVATLPAIGASALAPGGQVPIASSWASGAVLAGLYQVRAQLFTLEGEALATGISTFAIAHDGTTSPAATLRVTTDRPSYNTTDSVAISTLARNLTQTTLMPAAQVNVTVTAPGGAVLMNQSFAAADLVAGAMRQQGTTLSLAGAAEGTYSVVGTLRDGGGVTVASGNASFEVEEDASVTLLGTVAAASPQVVAGQAQVCTETATNRGTQGFAAQALRHVVVRLSDAVVVAQTAFNAALPAGGSHIEVLSVATGGYQAGDYGCVLQAQVNNQWRDLGHATFNVVRPPVLVEGALTVGPRGRLLVLVDSPIDPQQPHDPFGSSELPNLVTQRAHLESVLEAAGWSYTIVDCEEDFDTAFSTGDYAVYAILSEAVSLSANLLDRVVSAVHAGAGLLVAGSYDDRLGNLMPVLGIEWWPDWTLYVSTLVIETSDVMDAVEVPITMDPWPLGMELQGATPIAHFISVVPDPNEETAAVTTYQYGQGRSVYTGLDLVMQGAGTGDDSVFAELFVNALSYVHPSTLTPNAGSVLPLRMTLTNAAAETSGRVVLTLPAGVTVVDSGAWTVQPDGTLVWAYALDEAEALELPLWVTLPAQPGDIVFRTSVQNGAAPNYTELSQQSLTVHVVPAQ